MSQFDRNNFNESSENGPAPVPRTPRSAHQGQPGGFVPAGTRPTSGSHAAGRHAASPVGEPNFGNPYGGEKLIRVRKKRHKGLKIAGIVLAVILAIILGIGAAFALWVKSLDSSMDFATEEDKQNLLNALNAPESSTVAQEDAPFYMLILGLDTRDGDHSGRSDVIMLARVDSATGTVDLISIPRDTMVNIEGQGVQKINAAYTFGGAAGAVEAVSAYAGVPISHYAEVNFQELESVVDMLGGIWVNIPEDISAGNGGMDFAAGEQKLNGEQALAFARERYNVSGGDFGRAQAQRQVVEAIIKQVLASSPIELPGIVGRLASSVTTDYSVGDIVNLAQKFQGKNLSLYSAAAPSYSLSVDGVSYVGTMYAEWADMMKRVDAGIDPNDASVVIPEPQASDSQLGAATNAASPREYADLAANAGLTTDDVASVN